MNPPLFHLAFPVDVMLVYPRLMFDYVGAALVVTVIVLQKLRPNEARAATG